MKSNGLVPKNKFDTKAIERLSIATKSEVLPILGDLLMWLQDLNWPVAKELIELLPRFQADLTPHILEVLHSDDAIWKNSVLQLVESFTKEYVLNLSIDIKRIANHPNVDEQFEETYFYAKNIIKKFDL